MSIMETYKFQIITKHQTQRLMCATTNPAGGERTVDVQHTQHTQHTQGGRLMLLWTVDAMIRLVLYNSVLYRLQAVIECRDKS